MDDNATFLGGNFFGDYQDFSPNKSNSTTSETLFNTHWIYYVPGPLICGFGIVFNILNLIVLCDKELKSPTYIYFKALGVSDSLVLLLSFIHLVTVKATDTFLKAFYNTYIFFSTGNIFFNTSVWLVVMVTIERVLFVMKPITMKPTETRARCLISLVLVFCICINVPRYFCYEIFQMYGNYYTKGADFRSSTVFYSISWCHAVVINFVPNVVLLVANTTLIWSLYKAGNDRKALHSNKEEAMQKDQKRLTKTLVAIVIMFFICIIPSAFADDPIAYSLFGNGRSWDDYLRSPANQNFLYVSNLLVFMNSSLNFLLYCAFNSKYRNAAKRACQSVYIQMQSQRHGRADTTGSSNSTQTTAT